MYPTRWAGTFLGTFSAIGAGATAVIGLAQNVPTAPETAAQALQFGALPMDGMFPWKQVGRGEVVVGAGRCCGWSETQSKRLVLEYLFYILMLRPQPHCHHYLPPPDHPRLPADSLAWHRTRWRCSVLSEWVWAASPQAAQIAGCRHGLRAQETRTACPGSLAAPDSTSMQ